MLTSISMEKVIPPNPEFAEPRLKQGLRYPLITSPIDIKLQIRVAVRLIPKPDQRLLTQNTPTGTHVNQVGKRLATVSPM